MDVAGRVHVQNFFFNFLSQFFLIIAYFTVVYLCCVQILLVSWLLAFELIESFAIVFQIIQVNLVLRYLLTTHLSPWSCFLKISSRGGARIRWCTGIKKSLESSLPGCSLGTAWRDWMLLLLWYFYICFYYSLVMLSIFILPLSTLRTLSLLLVWLKIFSFKFKKLK